MTQTTTATLSVGVRKIRRELRERGGKTILDHEVKIPTLSEQPPTLFGFRFEGYQHVHVVVKYDNAADELVLIGYARNFDDFVPVEERVAKATDQGLTMDVGDYTMFLEAQAPELRWPATESRRLAFDEPWPDGLKLALMRELGLRV